MKKFLFLFFLSTFYLLSSWADDNIITFADENVKAICVANWDTNEDGELSEAEAAAVTKLGEVFKGNTDITSFDELQYFTGLTEISYQAFGYCSNLTEIIFPCSLNTIGSDAFMGCRSLTSLIIPSYVANIGSRAFKECEGLISIQVDSNNPTFDSRNNCNAIIEKKTSTLIVGCKNTIIPSNVIRIGGNAFDNCTGLNSIIIPGSVTSIGNNAFDGCRGLTSVIFGNGVTSIEGSAFAYCSNLTSVTLPYGLTNMAEWVFRFCDKLASVSIPSSVTNIGWLTFGDCSSLTSVRVDWATPISISSDVFSNRTNATLYIPTGSKAAYEVADFWKEFKEIVEFTPYINFADDNVKTICVANWDTDGDGELSYEEAATVTNLGNVFTLNENITSFDELQFFTGLTEIGEHAFYGCNRLSSLIMPNTIKQICYRAFGGTTLSEFSIPNGVEILQDEALSGIACPVTIPSSVTFIGSRLFWGGSPQAIVISHENPIYDSRENCNAIIESATNNLIAGCQNTIIPNTVTSIGEHAFSFTNLTSITIPNSVTSIAGHAFWACDNLETAYINCILWCNPRYFFPHATIIYGEDGGYAYIEDVDGEYLNTYENPITKEIVSENDRQIRIPIKIGNKNFDISQIQFELYTGQFSLAEDGNGKYKVELDKIRFNYDEDFGYSHTITSTEIEYRHYRIVITNPDNTPIVEDEDGSAAIYITLRLDDDIKDGDYGIGIHNVEFSSPTAEKLKPSDYDKNVKVFLRDLGDFNNDEMVSVTDYAGVVKFVAGQGYEDQGVPEWVIFKASDVNEDNEVSVTDVSGIVNIILYGNYTGKTSNAKARRTEKTSGASLSIEPFSISGGETKEIIVNLSSAYTDLSQCQFDLTLPEGLSVAEVNGKAAIYPGGVIRSADGFSHMVSSAQREDGTLRVVCLSGSNEAFNDIEGSIVKIKIVADKEMKANSADIEISNVEFANTDASMVMGVGSTTPVSLGDGVTNIDPLKESSLNKYDIYSADGIQRDRLSRGLNIVRYIDGSTKKVMVK